MWHSAGQQSVALTKCKVPLQRISCIPAANTQKLAKHSWFQCDFEETLNAVFVFSVIQEVPEVVPSITTEEVMCQLQQPKKVIEFPVALSCKENLAHRWIHNGTCHAAAQMRFT